MSVYISDEHRKLLTTAAEIINANAEELKASHTVDGVWPSKGPEDRATLQRYLLEHRTALQLRAAAIADGLEVAHA